MSLNLLSSAYDSDEDDDDFGFDKQTIVDDEDADATPSTSQVRTERSLLPALGEAIRFNMRARFDEAAFIES